MGNFSASWLTARAAGAAVILFLGCLAVPKTAHAASIYNVQFSFTGTSPSFPGSSPETQMVLLGSTLYGTAFVGGLNSNGVLFSYNPTTQTYTDLVDFTGSSGSFMGASPHSTPIPLGTVLYGTTEGGGVVNIGVIYSFDTVSHTYIFQFDFNSSTAITPSGNLALIGSTLYGTTQSGGAHNFGVIYSFNTATQTYNDLYNFAGGTDGSTPIGGLVLSGTTLYGTTSSGGGASNFGTIFSYNTATSTYTKLYDFTGGQGYSPIGGLVVSGTTLYGTTEFGGTLGFGVLFSYDTSTMTYTDLMEFTGVGGAFPGGVPQSTLLLLGSVLYGTTEFGGTVADNGVIFSYNTATNVYRALFPNFNTPNGENPLAGLTLVGNTFYGSIDRRR